MLYFVSTPIGNLKDITLRALDVLKEVDVIFAEDTRHTLGLLNAYEIKKPLYSYHKFNEIEVSSTIIERLCSGENIAVVSDAGAPMICDPGNVLVERLVENNLPFTHVSGGCAFVSALVLGGLPTDKFSFIGFLPQKKSQAQQLLKSYENLDSTLIFYSAPHDVKKDIETLFGCLGNRRAVAVREISKMYEERIEFMLADGLGKEPRGEFVLLVSGKKEKVDYDDEYLKNEILSLVKAGMPKTEAVKAVSKLCGVPKNRAYKISLDLE